MLLESIFTILIIALLVCIAGRLREPSSLPPGPRPLPLIGNLLDIDMKCAHQSFMKLAEKYGNVFTVYLGGERTVVLNSVSLIREALVTRKDDFAGRPKSFLQDYTTWEAKTTAFIDFGPAFIYQKKLLHIALRKFSEKTLHENLKIEVAQLIQRFKDYGNADFDPFHDVQMAIINTICAMLFGERYEANDKAFLETTELNDKTFELLAEMTWLNVFPWLIHFPLKKSREVKRVCKMRDQIFVKKYNEHLDSFVDGYPRDFTDALIQAQKDGEAQDNAAKKLSTKYHIIATLYEMLLGGKDSLSAAILWSIVYLVRCPEVQAKVHEELDDVIGRERVPSMDDKDKLPYLEAMIYETIRFSPLSTIEVPHKATKDSTIQGYHIPAGTTILLNIFAAKHEECSWEEPYAFNPMRFIDGNGKCNAKGPQTLSFGAGRRSCPGESLAKVELFMFMSRLLHQFEFSVPPGCPLPSLDSKFGLVSKPLPFKISCKDRLDMH